MAQIAVYGDDLIIMPPQGDGTFSKRILTCGTLGVLDHLARSGLTDVQKGAAFEVTGGHFLVRFNAHGRIPRAWLSAIAASTSTTSPRRSLGKGAAAVGHRRKLSGAVEDTHEHAPIHATIP
jgi:hypothetical protein